VHKLPCKQLCKNMTNSRKSVKLEVSGEIVCKVQAVLDDLILVSYQANNNKVFQGILLDSTRRYRFMKKNYVVEIFLKGTAQGERMLDCDS
jgi:hypothetical protein